MTVAEETRTKLEAHHFLYLGLRAGVLNYSAVARFLESEDIETAAAALRRYSESVDSFSTDTIDSTIRMHSGVSPGSSEPVVTIGRTEYGGSGGEFTALVSNSQIGSGPLGAILQRLDIVGISVEAVSSDSEGFAVVVPRTDGPAALRCIEETAVPVDSNDSSG